MGELEFDALGPLRVRRGDATIELGPPQRRLVLVRLLVAGGVPVCRDRLLADLWGADAPGGATSALHAHISRLRAVLGGRATLVRDGSGYTLLAEPEACTTVRFETAARRARRLAAEGDHARARGVLEPALDLWRGKPFEDAAALGFARAAAARLQECRVAAAELHVEILLALGEPQAATAEARELTVDHPLRESAWELLIRALYRSGRSAEALQQYGRIRNRLAEMFGAEPGPALRRLHLSVLRQDPSLAA
ncbi:AfsR/SARP family transcriptional regulator [Actinoplanes sp. NPDC051851]|uniref:AfsR/SARP family transcriptional regulator n=1 Tax=Actinoplanes sp. NPDC051851 TaxID=3154753 RepID=UPI00342DA3B1